MLPSVVFLVHKAMALGDDLVAGEILLAGVTTSPMGSPFEVGNGSSPAITVGNGKTIPTGAHHRISGLVNR